MLTQIPSKIPSNEPPFLDSLTQQLEMRFNSLAVQAARALALLPPNTDFLHADNIDFIALSLHSFLIFMMFYSSLFSF